MINCFYFIDKPLNYSSFDVIRVLKKKLGIKRIGHTGTLDPLATGGLLIAVGNYTKLIPYLEKDKKTYEFTINFDGKSESFDLGTKIEYFDKKTIDNFKKEVNKEKIQDILNKKFSGKIKQVAPKYSAKKINGKRAYDLARAGEDFKIKANDVEIYSIEILEYDFPRLTLKANVSAGTYIRSIANDLGSELGLSGAYVSYLRRIEIGNLKVKEAQDLNDFDENQQLDLKKLFKENKFIYLDKNIKNKIDNGLQVNGNFNYPIGEKLFVFDGDKISNIVLFDGKSLIPIKKI